MFHFGKMAALHNLALKTYIDAAYENDYLAMFISMAIIFNIENNSNIQ